MKKCTYMHCLEISSPNLVLLYQFPETELVRIKTVMDSNRRFSFLTLRRVILIIPIILLISSYSLCLRLGYTTKQVDKLTDMTRSHFVTQNCHVLYDQEKQFSNPHEHTSSASTASFGNVQSLIVYLRESQVYGDPFILIPSAVVRWR